MFDTVKQPAVKTLVTKTPFPAIGMPAHSPAILFILK